MAANITLPEHADRSSGSTAVTRLTRNERLLLLIPLLGGLFFGLMPLLARPLLATISGASGDDPYIYRLAGAATLGYAVCLILVMRQSDWRVARLIIVATLAFNLASIYAIATDIAAGTAMFITYAILFASITISAITAWLLYRHRGAAPLTGDVASWLFTFVAALALVATVVALVTILAPHWLAETFGFKGTDVFLYRQAAAATLGYGVMGFVALRTPTWPEWRLMAVMALVFNAVAFVVSVIALTAGDPPVLPVVFGGAGLLSALGSAAALIRRGR